MAKFLKEIGTVSMTLEGLEKIEKMLDKQIKKEKEVLKMNENELIKKGFEESGVELEEYDMCQACKDAVAVDRSRGLRVCRDCYYEMGV